MSEKEAKGYLHGFTREEQDRLYHQARFVEHRVHERLPFQRSRNLLEVGSGVGAQTDILLRHFPELHITGVDRSPENLKRAAAHLATQPWTEGRYELREMAAENLDYDQGSFDAAFLCWILEHVGDPQQVLAEVRRVLRPGSPIVITEVQNATFFIEPYSPNVLAYWMAFNDHQFELGGDPFVGAKLGNLLLSTGYRDIVTDVRTIHLDSRVPGERAEFIEYWTDLLLSGAGELQSAGKVTEDTVAEMSRELKAVAHDPNAVFFYSFVQARARVY